MIDRLVGLGSFAWVYHAYTRDGREVAVKILHSVEPTARVRFAREILVLKALPSTPSLVRYVDHGYTPDGWPLLVLEFVDGISLKEGIARCSTLAPGKAAAFLAELCEAFVGLHQLGVAHRDVKPENILLARAGGIKLIDFGLIRDAQGILKLLEQDDPLERQLFAQELDQSVLVGTPEYMAPEQFSDATMDSLEESRTDTWSDVYSLGVILYQLLSGWKLYPMREVTDEEYPAEILRYMQWRIEQTDSELPQCPGIDEALESILRKALRRDPRQRQPDARDLLDDFVRYLESGEGVVQADETHTFIVSLEQLMKLQSERDAETTLPSSSTTDRNVLSHRTLPPFETEDEEDEDETVMTSSEPDLVDDDAPHQGHTVVFFAQEYLASRPEASREQEVISSNTQEFLTSPDDDMPTPKPTFEHEQASAVPPAADVNPWQELTPTRPRGSIEVSQLLVDLDPSIADVEGYESDEPSTWSQPPPELDIYGTIDAPPPTIENALEDDVEDGLDESEEVTNKVHIAEVSPGKRTVEPDLLDQDTRKVTLPEMEPYEQDQYPEKKR